jgi:hypothetical protein
MVSFNIENMNKYLAEEYVRIVIENNETIVSE